MKDSEFTKEMEDWIMSTFDEMNILFNHENNITRFDIVNYDDNFSGRLLSYKCKKLIFKNGKRVWIKIPNQNYIEFNISRGDFLGDFIYYKNNPEIDMYDVYLTLIHEFTHLKIRNHSRKFYREYYNNIAKWLVYRSGKNITVRKLKQKEKELLKLCSARGE